MMASEQDSNVAELTPNLLQAHKFIKTIMGLKQTCFQTFASREGDRIIPAHKHGSLNELSEWLTSQNQAGGGVYFVVNETDGTGRKLDNIVNIRAVFVDLDGAPVQPVMDAATKPHVIIESSPGRFQAFWKTRRDEIKLNEFIPIQKALTVKFNSDDNVNTIERVMRVPGFWHLKKEPFMSRIVTVNSGPLYTKSQIVEGLGLDVHWEEEKPLANSVEVDDGVTFPKGQRNRSLVTMSARLRNALYSGEELFAELMKVNRKRCVPPLGEKDVRRIAQWADKKEAREVTPARYYEYQNSDFIGPPPDPFETHAAVEPKDTKQPPPKDGPKLRDWHSLAHANLPPAKWIVQGILPQGLILFIGKAKTGKSWLAQALALQIAKGLPVLGHFPSNKGEVCVLALEDTHQRFQGRMKKLLQGNIDEAPKNAMYAIRWPRSPECFEPLEEWAKKCPHPRVVIIDVLNKMRPRLSKQDSFSDAYQKDYGFMQPFHAFAHKYGIAVIMIHHEKKGDSDDDYSRGSGSAALGAAADGLWILNHSERGENRGSLVVSGRDFESNEFSLEFEKETGLWRYIGSEKEVKRTEMQERILGAMAAIGKPATPSEIATAGELNFNSTKNGLFRLVEKGLVEKSLTQSHKYVVAGKSFLGETM